jgi:outer membrane protein assembly factor BamB
VAGSVLFVSGYDGRLYSLNARDGSRRWSARVNVDVTDPLRSPPAADAHQVYVFGDTGVFAFPRDCASQCAPAWVRQIRITSWNTVAVAGGNVFATANDTLYALDAATGAIRWKAAVPLVASSPAVGENVVVTTSRDALGTVQGFDQAGCGGPVCLPFWTVSTGGSVFDPTIANGVAYAGVLNSDYLSGGVYAFDLHCSGTCSWLWSGDTIGAIEWPVAVANGHLYASTMQAWEYAFGLPG